MFVILFFTNYQKNKLNISLPVGNFLIELCVDITDNNFGFGIDDGVFLDFAAEVPFQQVNPAVNVLHGHANRHVSASRFNEDLTNLNDFYIDIFKNQ